LSYSGFYTARSSKQTKKRHVSDFILFNFSSTSMSVAHQVPFLPCLQLENGRIIIDPHAFDIHCMPGPNLEPIDTTSHLISADDDNLLDGDHNIVYQTTIQAFRQYQDILGKCEKLWENDITACRKPLFQYSLRPDP
jgi:hypothetical protein